MGSSRPSCRASLTCHAGRMWHRHACQVDTSIKRGATQGWGEHGTQSGPGGCYAQPLHTWRHRWRCSAWRNRVCRRGLSLPPSLMKAERKAGLRKSALASTFGWVGGGDRDHKCCMKLSTWGAMAPKVGYTQPVAGCSGAPAVRGWHGGQGASPRHGTHPGPCTGLDPGVEDKGTWKLRRQGRWGWRQQAVAEAVAVP